MPKLELLIATMHRENADFVADMNLPADALVINQCDRTGEETYTVNGRTVRMICTTERGLSKSRNMALKNATGEICLLADDDICYSDRAADAVLSAFKEQSRADVIAFNMDTSAIRRYDGTRKITEKRPAPKNRYYSTVCIAFRRRSVGGIRFNERFGSGGQFPCGEESLFLRNCRKKKLKIEENPAYILKLSASESTWYTGYNAEYYRAKGAFLVAAYGKAAFFYGMYYPVRRPHGCSLSRGQMIKALWAGMREYRTRTESESCC